VPARRSHFVLEVGDDIAAQPYAEESNEPQAARRLTDFLTSYFFPGAPTS
jgi:hypothetical protein